MAPGGKEGKEGTTGSDVAGRAPTLRDVAERAGVSKMSASLVLNGSRSNTRVSETTRQRIRRVADDIGYHPNAVARSLSRRETNIVAVCLSGFRAPRGRFFSELMSGIHEGCHDERKDLLFHGTFEGRSTDDIYAELLDGRAGGLILFARDHDPLAARLRQSARLPVVAIVDAIPGIPSVVADDAAGGRLVAEHLHAKGHRVVAYVQREEPPVSVARRYVGFRAAASALGMTVEDIQLEDWFHRGVSAATAHLVKGAGGTKRPTAVAFWADPSAEQFVRECDQRGVRVPGDIAVMGFDGAHESYDMTTIVAPWADVARTAVGLLVAQMNGEEVPSETTLPISLRQGNTA